jgi:hypothetical protein
MTITDQSIFTFNQAINILSENPYHFTQAKVLLDKRNGVRLDRTLDLVLTCHARWDAEHQH